MAKRALVVHHTTYTWLIYFFHLFVNLQKKISHVNFSYTNTYMFFSLICEFTQFFLACEFLIHEHLYTFFTLFVNLNNFLSCVNFSYTNFFLYIFWTLTYLIFELISFVYTKHEKKHFPKAIHKEHTQPSHARTP